MKPNKRYDVAISFAGEDRKHAEVLANALKCRSVAVFYDRYEKATLWGTNLYTHLFDLYQNQARYCVMLLSQHYAKKMWTKHELEAAQARAFQEHESYILSVRLDNTEIPGILPAYSPNLNLIERLWKWVKKKCLYSKYYATSEDFQQAIQECIAQAHSTHQAELKSLLTLEFQTFKEVPVIGEGGKVTPFPGAKQPQKKVSSKAA